MNIYQRRRQHIGQYSPYDKSFILLIRYHCLLHKQNSDKIYYLPSLGVYNMSCEWNDESKRHILHHANPGSGIGLELYRQFQTNIKKHKAITYEIISINERSLLL